MANRVVETVYELVDKVTDPLKRIGAAFRQARQEQAKMADQVEQSNQRLSGGFARLAVVIRSITALATAMVAAFSFGKVVDEMKEVLETGERFDDLGKKFATAFSGLEAGEAALQRVRTIADDVPFAFEEVAAAAVELKRLGFDPLDGSLQALLDNTAANDQSMQDLSATIEALGKASLRGELGTRALVSLTERGIPVFQLLSQALGKTESEIRAMAASGQLGGDAIKLLVQQLGKLRAGAAAAEVGDLDAQLQKVRDTLNRIRNDIAQGGSLEVARQQLQDVNRFLRQLADSPDFQRLEAAFNDTFEAGVTAARAFLDNVDIRELLSEIETLTQGLRAAFATLAASEQVLGPLLTVLDKLTISSKLLNQVAGIAFRELAEGMEALSGASTDAGDALTGVTTPLALVREELDVARIAVDAFKKAMATVDAKELGLTVAAKELADSIGSLAGPATEARKKIAELFQNVDAIPTSQLGDLALALSHVGQESLSAAVNVRTGLRTELAKLSGEDLLRFQTATRDAFDEFNTAAVDTAGIVDTTLLAALDKLGVSGEGLGERFTAAGRDIVATFQAVTQSAVATSDQIEAAFSQALLGVATVSEAEALGAALHRAGEQGKVGLDAMARSAVDLRNRLLELQNAADPLADSFARLGIQSQRELDRLASVARADFDLIQAAARQGGAAIDDVARAFESMGRAQLAAVANATPFEQNQVRAFLRARGEALGLTDALQRLGLAGEQAGDRVAAGADRATGALRQTAAAAGDAAAAADELSHAGAGTAQTFITIAGAAMDVSSALGDVSEAFRVAAEAQVGRRSATGGKESGIFTELQRQRQELEEQVRLVREQNAQYDELEQRIRALRGQFTFLGDDTLRQLAQLQQQLEDNQQRQKEQAQRDSQQQQGSQPSAPVPARSDAVTVQVNATVYGTIDEDIGRKWARALARPLDRELRDLARLRA